MQPLYLLHEDGAPQMQSIRTVDLDELRARVSRAEYEVDEAAVAEAIVERVLTRDARSPGPSAARAARPARRPGPLPAPRRSS